MDEFEVEIIEQKTTRRTDGPATRATAKTGRLVRGILMRPRLVIAAAAAVFVLLVGTPHAGWDYECRHPMRSGQPCRSVSYCAYYGIQGRRIVFPQDGQSCKLVTLLPPDWKRMM